MLDPLGINAKMKWYLVDHISQLSPSREQAQRAEYFFLKLGKGLRGEYSCRGRGRCVFSTARTCMVLCQSQLPPFPELIEWLNFCSPFSQAIFYSND